MRSRSRVFLPRQPLWIITISLLVLASLFLVAPAFAGTHMDYSFIGFSADGRYAALEVSGVVDGLGELVCSVDIYDLEQNQKLPDAPRDTRGGGISCETARSGARSTLRELGISGKVQGEDIGISLESRAGGPGRATQREFTHKETTCVVSLHEAPYEGDNPWGGSMVKWNLGLSCGGETERLLLVEDYTNFSVKIVEARIVKNHLVLFTRTSHPDFEGPGSSPGVISAPLRATPPEGIKYAMEMIGFSDDAAFFAYWLTGVHKMTGRAQAMLMVLSTETGQPVVSEYEFSGVTVLDRLKARMAKELAARKLGRDLGAELYKSGTATKTTFSLGKRGAYEVSLKTTAGSGIEGDDVDVQFMGPDKKAVSLLTFSNVYNCSLNSVRLSKDGSVLAVVTKFSRMTESGEDREYAVAFSRLEKTNAGKSAGKATRSFKADKEPTCIAFSPDNSTIAVGYDYEDNTLRLLSRDGKLLATLTGHKSRITSIAFSPDSNQLASTSWDGTVRIWSIDGKLLNTLIGHNKGTESIAFSPDGARIITGGGYDDKSIKLWSRDGKLLQTLTGHRDGVSGIAVSPDGKTFASSSWDKTIRLWTMDGKLLTSLSNTKGREYTVAYRPDGGQLVSGSEDGQIRLWSPDGKLSKTIGRKGQEVRSVAISPDGKMIASAGNGPAVKLWDMDGRFLTSFTGRTSVAFSPDGALIASGSDNKTVTIRSLPDLFAQDAASTGCASTGKIVHTLDGHRWSVTGVAFSPDGSRIISSSGDKSIRSWSTDGKPLEKTLVQPDYVTGIKVSPDGTLIAAGFNERNTVLVLKNGSLKATLTGPSQRALPLAFSPDNGTVLVGSDDKSAYLFEISKAMKDDWHNYRNWTSRVLTPFHRDMVRSGAASPDGSLFATGSWDKTVKLWDREGIHLADLKGHKAFVMAVAFLPDSSALLSADSEGIIKFWNRDGKQLKSFSAHDTGINALAVSPDGSAIASASYDETIKVWDRNGRPLKTLKGHENRVNDVAFSPDGKLIASASEDTTVRVWSWDSAACK